MHIRKKILKTIIAGAILTAIVFTWYINKFFGPTNLKNFFIKNISHLIDRPVSLKGVRFSLVHGLTLNELTIYEPDGKTIFIDIKRLSTTLLFIPLLKEKKVIIPSIQIDHPSVNIVKNQDASWNFLHPPLMKKGVVLEKTKENNFSFLVRRIQITNGEINFSDTTKLPIYSKQLINLNGEVALSIKDAIVNFKTASQLKSPLKTNIGLDGSYFLKQNLFMIKTAVRDLAVSDPYNYFYMDKPGFPLDLQNGVADISLELKIDGDKRLLLVVDSLVKNLDVSALGVSLKGDVGISGVFDSKLSESPQLNYKVGLDFKLPTLSGVYLLNEISNLNGRVEILNDAIHSANLEGYAYGTPIRFSGGIDLRNLQLRLNTQAVLDLANYKNFLPEKLKEGFKDINLEGHAEVNIKFFDRLKDPQPVDIDGRIRLKAAALKVPVLTNKFEKISGEILFKNNRIYISRTSFDYGVENYTLDAKVTNPDLPDVKMKLKNKDISLNSRFQILKDKVHILLVTGKYINSSFSAAGDIEKSENPTIAYMRGNVALDLVDLRKLFPAASGSLTKVDLKGACNLDFYLNGPWKNPRMLEAVMNGKSNAISLWGLKFNEVKLGLKMKDKYLLISELSAKPYDGAFSSTLEMDLTQQNPPYTINLAIEEVDLSKLILDTDLKNKQISGKILCKANMRGYGKNSETIRGEGLIFVKGGYLWEIPLLRGIADLFFMPNLSSIVFDEASCHFAIANKAISTSDLKFHSQSVGLLAEGSLFFDGAIDFLVTTSISENFIKGTSEFERLAGALLAEAGQFIGRIKIGGTIKKAEYRFVPFPLDKILRDKVKKLLGGFF